MMSETTQTRPIVVEDRKGCWCCPPIIEEYERTGWPDFEGQRYQPHLKQTRRRDWVVRDTTRDVMLRRLGGHQALAIYWSAHHNNSTSQGQTLP